MIKWRKRKKTKGNINTDDKLELLERVKLRIPPLRNFEDVGLYTRLMIIHARIMNTLPQPMPEWPHVIREWRKRLQDPYYIMEIPSE